MCEIKYMLKPEWVSWDAIQECQRKAHEDTNNKKGFHMLVQDISGDALRQEMEDNGQCFVALDGDKVVGMCGVKIIKGNKWWSRGKKVAYNTIDAILPEYQGTDVYFELNDLRQKYIKDSGVRIIQSNTSEYNTLIRKIAKKKGFKIVMYTKSGKGADYYSLIFVKWLDGCPFSDKFINFMFNLSKIFVRTVYRPDGNYRFCFRKK